MPRKAKAGTAKKFVYDQHSAAVPASPKAAKTREHASHRDQTRVVNAAPLTGEAPVGLSKDLSSIVEPVPHASGKANSRVSSDHCPSASSLAPQAAADHQRIANHPTGVSSGDLSSTLAAIRAFHRDRCFAMEERKRSDLALGAFLRRGMGWSRALPKAESDRIKKAAQTLIALGEKVMAGKTTGIGEPYWDQFAPIIVASLKGRAHWDAIEHSATKDMERLARSLPVWETFGEPIKGFGARSLAVILAETGDLSNYANPGKVWKRMGLAVIKGVRQGGLRKNSSAEEWIAHGYNAKRRSFMFVIGDVLVKNQNAYRELYLHRKTVERAKAEALGLTVVPAAKIPAKRKDEFRSDGHIHRLAQRYMEKRLLKHLWQAWQRTQRKMQPSQPVFAAEHSG